MAFSSHTEHKKKSSGPVCGQHTKQRPRKESQTFGARNLARTILRGGPKGNPKSPLLGQPGLYPPLRPWCACKTKPPPPLLLSLLHCKGAESKEANTVPDKTHRIIRHHEAAGAGGGRERLSGYLEGRGGGEQGGNTSFVRGRAVWVGGDRWWSAFVVTGS